MLGEVDEGDTSLREFFIADSTNSGKDSPSRNNAPTSNAVELGAGNIRIPEEGGAWGLSGVLADESDARATISFSYSMRERFLKLERLTAFVFGSRKRSGRIVQRGMGLLLFWRM